MYFPHLWSANAIAARNKVSFGLASINLGRLDRWISLLTKIVAELWLRMARKREIRRMRTAWATIDDRTLRDIGVSRWEMAYAEVRQRRAADMKVTQPCGQAMGRGFSRRGVEIASRIS